MLNTHAPFGCVKSSEIGLWYVYRLPRVRVKNITPSHAPPAFFHTETLREHPPASPFLDLSKDQIPALLPVFSRFKIEPDEAVGRLGLQGEFRLRARHVTLPRDASLDGSAVERLLAAAEPRNAFLARRKKSRSGGFGWIIGIMRTTGLTRAASGAVGIFRSGAMHQDQGFADGVGGPDA